VWIDRPRSLLSGQSSTAAGDGPSVFGDGVYETNRGPGVGSPTRAGWSKGAVRWVVDLSMCDEGEILQAIVHELRQNI
jgi:hypothetical protein